MSFDDGLIAGLTLGAKKSASVSVEDPDPDLTIWKNLPEPADNEIVSLIRVLDVSNANYYAIVSGYVDGSAELTGSTVMVHVDWGDGSADSYELPVYDYTRTWNYMQHTYTKPGDYIVTASSDNIDICMPHYIYVYGYRNIMIKCGDGILYEKYLQILPNNLSRNYLKYIRVSSKTIFKYTFQGFNYLRLIEYNGEPLTEIPDNMFYSCQSLKFDNWDFSKVKTVGQYGFNACRSVTHLSFPACTKLENYAFALCQGLQNIELPVCTEIKQGSLSSCQGLTIKTFPECISVGNDAFGGCFQLTEINLPKCTSIGSSAFSNLYNLVKIAYADGCVIGSNAFQSCHSLYPIPT